MGNENKRYGWPAVMAVIVGLSMVLGLTFELLNSAGLLPRAVTPILIGMICGVGGPLLVMRMRPAR